jgi:hypothetical protein
VSRTEAAGPGNAKTATWISDSASTGPVSEGLATTSWKGQLVRIEYGTGYTQNRVTSSKLGSDFSAFRHTANGKSRHQRQGPDRRRRP